VSKYERLARLLKIVTLVRANPRLTRSDLARLCEVDSVRTIQRDINSLAIAEVPIYWSGEGYEIMPNFFLPPIALSVEEAFSLVLCASAYSDGEGKFHEGAIKSALSKIVATLPKATRVLLEADVDKISIESRKAMDIGGLINQLYQAILNTKQLRMNYYTYSRNSVSERVVDPYALAFRRHAWYLIAFCHMRSEILMFRANRIKTLDYTGKTFSYPYNFSLEKYMGNSWQSMRGEETEVVVKFDAKVAPLIKEVNWHPTQHIENLPDGSIIYTATVAGTKEISLWILGYGHQAEVLKPKSLREEIAAVARKMYQRYQKIQLQ
jgi:predicted DNA-binding transcriptional regulator YafY